MEIKVTNLNTKEPVSTVKISGRIDSYTSAILEQELDVLIRTGRYHLIVDLENVERITTEGINVLIKLRNYTTSFNGDLKLLRPSEAVEKTLKFAGVTKQLKLYFTEKEALSVYTQLSETPVQDKIRPGAYIEIEKSNIPVPKQIEILTNKKYSIGRTKENDIYLKDTAVSRNHAVIEFNGKDFIIKDLDSTNGTIVNDKKIVNHYLQDGDKIEIGETLMVFKKAPINWGIPGKL